MKYSLFIILLIAFNNFAQSNSETLLPIEIIKIKSPSASAFDEIRKIISFDTLYNKAIKKYAEDNGSTKGFEYDLSSYFNYLRKLVLSNDELIVRQYAALQIPKLIIRGYKLEESDSTLKRICLEIMKPDDIIWKVETDYSLLIFKNMYTNFALHDFLKEKSLTYAKLNTNEKIEYEELGYAKSFEYYEKIFKDNPDRIVKAAALIRILETISYHKKYDLSQYYYDILKNDFTDLNDAKINIALLNYNPSAKLKVGSIIPEFSFNLVDSPKIISSSSMLGKYYLIQIWATWCAPCISEMPMIRKAFEKYNAPNFAIVSFSMDYKLENLHRFWALKSEMPWNNVFVEKGFDDEFIKELGITGVPVLILVGKDGTILETNFDSEESLLKMIGHVVEKNN